MPLGYSVYFSERPKNRVIRWNPDSGTAEVVAGDRRSRDSRYWLGDPYGLALDGNGELLVADKHAHRVCRLRNGALEAIRIEDTTGARRRKPNSAPDYDPRFLTPSGIFRETGGSFLIAFHNDLTIYRLHSDGRLELVLGRLRNDPYLIEHAREAVPAPEVSATPIYLPLSPVSRSDGTIFLIERGYQIVREYHPSRGLRSLFPFGKAQEFLEASQGPSQAAFDQYHPALPAALALDGAQNLYLAEARHGCVFALDTAARTLRKVIESQSSVHPERGIHGLCFGPDGTAWVLDAGAGAVIGYQPTPSGLWNLRPERLDRIGGEPICWAQGGTGMAAG